MSTSYTVQVDEGSNDLKQLTPNNYDLALAKAMSVGGGAAVINTIFQSSNTPGQKVGNTTTMTWQENYGLNYSQNIPAKGAQVTVGGVWQPMNLGDIYSLDTNGSWQFDSKDPSVPNNLSVVNNYQPVHIIVGVSSSDGTGKTIWNPIFFDPDQILMNVTGSYQPLETIHLWWAEEQIGGTVIAHQSTPVKQYTLTSSATVYFWYDATRGVWQEQTTGPFTPA